MHAGACINVHTLAVPKIVLRCCRLCRRHRRGMWAMRQLRSALQNCTKICYSNTHFLLEEGPRDRGMDGSMEQKCYFNKAGVITSSNHYTPIPTTTSRLPHILIFCTVSQTHGSHMTGCKDMTAQSSQEKQMTKIITA